MNQLDWDPFEDFFGLGLDMRSRCFSHTCFWKFFFFSLPYGMSSCTCNGGQMQEESLPDVFISAWAHEMNFHCIRCVKVLLMVGFAHVTKEKEHGEQPRSQHRVCTRRPICERDAMPNLPGSWLFAL
jgi:hypothetical protein